MTDYTETSPERVAEQRRALIAWSWAHPGVELVQGAALVGVTLDVAAAMLGERARLHPRHERIRERTYTDAELVTAIRAHVTATGDRRAASYRLAAREHGWPSLDGIIRRMGTLREALAAAGVSEPDPQRTRGPAYGDAELRAWVAAYIADAPHPTWRDMDTWLRDHNGPTATTVRKRLGRWADVLAAAVPSPLTDDEGPAPSELNWTPDVGLVIEG